VLAADSPQQAAMQRFSIDPLIDIALWHGLGLEPTFCYAALALRSRRRDPGTSARGYGQRQLRSSIDFT
jgi:hypothetical protein